MPIDHGIESEPRVRAERGARGGQSGAGPTRAPPHHCGDHDNRKRGHELVGRTYTCRSVLEHGAKVDAQEGGSDETDCIEHGVEHDRDLNATTAPCY